MLQLFYSLKDNNLSQLLIPNLYCLSGVEGFGSMHLASMGDVLHY